METINDKIHICNWLLTRRCNLSCTYCSISRELENKPSEYKLFDYYLKNEMSLEYIIDILDSLKNHNPEMFHIFYGGEPFLRKDLHHIINHCNKNNIHYTIISNCSDEIIPLIDKCFMNVEYIQGFTASVDPYSYEDYQNNTDQYKKSKKGMETLLKYKNIVKDLVAEITVTNENKNKLYNLVCTLSDNNITSDITFLDIKKNNYYDFSNVSDENKLVKFDNELLLIYSQLLNNYLLKIHMRDNLLTETLRYSDSSYRCNLNTNLHNITIDSDGSLRTCLRIRGIRIPKANEMFDSEFKILRIIRTIIANNIFSYCNGCNWPCVMMSDLLSKNENLNSDLIHKKEREI